MSDRVYPHTNGAERFDAEMAEARYEPAPAPERWVVFDPVASAYLAFGGHRGHAATVDVGFAAVWHRKADAEYNRVLHWPNRASAFAMKLYQPTVEEPASDA